MRKANNPIAFPAFDGKYGNIKEDSHDLIRNLSGNTIFDIDMDDSLQLVALVTNLSKIEANIGKFAILSDEDSKNSYSSDLITNSGFTLLNNESKLIYILWKENFD